MSIYDLIEQQRAALLARDASTLAELTRRWGPVAAQIERQSQTLAQEVARRQANGETVSRDMLMRLARYREFARQVRSVVGEYGGTVAPDIARAQREAFGAGASDATRQLQEMGVSASFTRLPVEATNVIIGTAADGSPLRDLIAASWPDAVGAITGKLIEGVALGRNPRVIAREMAQGSGVGLARALNIARTEQIRAYRESSRALYQQAGIAQYRRISAKNARTCPLCLALDGRIYDTQSAMHSHPSCRCTSTPIVPGYTFPPRQSAAEWFADQDEDTQRAALGPGRLDLYRRGVPLGAMVELYDDPAWGPQTRARTLAQINAAPGRVVDMGRVRVEASRPVALPVPVAPQYQPPQYGANRVKGGLKIGPHDVSVAPQAAPNWGYTDVGRIDDTLLRYQSGGMGKVNKKTVASDLDKLLDDSIIEALRTIPPSHLRYVSSVDLERFASASFEGLCTAPIADTGKSRITLSFSVRDDGTIKRTPSPAVLVHEVGHAVSFRITEAQARKWLDAVGYDSPYESALDIVGAPPSQYVKVRGPTEYGDTSAGEAFAETYALLHIGQSRPGLMSSRDRHGNRDTLLELMREILGELE